MINIICKALCNNGYTKLKVFEIFIMIILMQKNALNVLLFKSLKSQLYNFEQMKLVVAILISSFAKAKKRNKLHHN
jgi:hypothetical protein